MSKRLFKKMYKVIHFYTDTNNRFEFYYRKNWLGQFDMMVYDIENNLNRWFMITPALFYSFMGIEKDEQLHTLKRNVDGGMKPKVANEYINKHQFQVISHKVKRYNADTVVAKIGEFGPEDERQRVVLIKRIASVPEKDFMVLGMDTIEIPFEGIKNFLDDAKKRYFKDVQLEMEEDEDATN